MTDSLLTPEALAAVGSRRPVRRGQIAATEIRKFCVAIDDLDPVYLDRDAAIAVGHADVIAPPLFPAAATRPVPDHTGLLIDGQYDDLAPPGLGHLQSILAGQEWEFFRPAVAGEQVTETVGTCSVAEQQGRTGPMVLVGEESMLRAADGEPILKSVNHLVLRPPPADVAAGPVRELGPDMSRGPVTTVSADTLVKRPSMVSQFMFCAAIWAVHRIHYDAAYARSEGLPGPILPGWMLSSYFCQFAKTRADAGCELRTLSLRYKAMAFAGDALTCQGTPTSEEAGMKLFMTNQSGIVVVSGFATFARP